MKYFTLVAVLVAATTATSCCHTRYTEAKETAVLLFQIGDVVYLSPDSVACTEHLAICNDRGVVMHTLDIKNACYPQASYEVKLYHQIDNYTFCATDLVLLKRKY